MFEWPSRAKKLVNQARMRRADQAFRYSHIPPGQVPNQERYPPLIPGQNESFLPSHPLYRYGMLVPPPHLVAHQGAGYRPPERKKKGGVSKPQEVERINAKVEEIIEDLSSRGKFLPVDVIRRVAQGLIQGASNSIHIKEIEAYNQFLKLHGRIDELIKVYCIFTPITSLHELGIALAHAEKVSTYEELHLGPLVKHPRASDYFKPPEGVDTPPEITVHKLHCHLTKMIDKTKRGTKLSIEEFLEFVRKKEEAESVEHLCIRIQSFPLLIQVGC